MLQSIQLLETNMSASAKQQPTRRASKEFRRRQLIEATIYSIAKRGLGDTTLAHVSTKAGLSQGIINLHFSNKDNLLTEALKYLRDEYEKNWRTSLSKSPEDAASQLASLLKADYNTKVADPKKLAVWFAFWGEVKSRPTYKKICQSRVSDYTKILEEMLNSLIKEGSYEGLNADELSQTIISLADGLWLNMLVSSGELKRSDATHTMMQYMAQIFPKHKSFFQ